MRTPALRTSAILEIKAQSYKELYRILSPSTGPSLTDLLTQQTFDGHNIIFASQPYIPEREEICTVPHFNHSVNCDEPCQGNGVYRLFEFDIFFELPENGATTDLIGTYNITPWIEISISSAGKPIDLDSIADYADPRETLIGRFDREYDYTAITEAIPEHEETTVSKQSA
jgi:hypothetical protein